MTNFRLSAHAEAVMAARGIRTEWVSEVLERPRWEEDDRADPALRHHLAPIAENGGRVLRVVFRRDTPEPLLVTVYFDRSVRNRL